MSNNLKRGGIVAAGVSILTSLALLLSGGGGDWNPNLVTEIPATQDIAYQAVPFARDTWGEAADLDSTIARVRDAMARHRGAGFQLRPKDREEWSFVRELAETMAVLKDNLRTANVDAVWYVRAVVDDYKWKARKVDLNPAAYMDTPGTVPIDIIIGTTVKEFPNVLNYGLFACRRVSGSWAWSQHAWYNAIDFGGGHEMLDDIAAYLKSLDAKGYIPLENLLWQVPGHYSHVHADGFPNFHGTPPCAG